MSGERSTTDASLRALARAIAGLQHASDGAQAAYRCVDAAVTGLGAARAVALLAQGEDELTLVAARGFEDAAAAPFVADSADAWLARALGPDCVRAPLPAPARGLLAACVAPGGEGDRRLRESLALLAVALSETLERRERSHRSARGNAARAEDGVLRRDDLRLALRGLGHDIRSPLQAAMMQHSLLASGGLGELNAEQREALQNMREALNGIRDMARAAWEVSRVLGGELDLAPAAHRVDDLVADVTAVARDTLEARGHTLDSVVDGDIAVTADAAAVTRILCALLDNAAKFAPPAARVALEARPCVDAPGFVSLSVSDSGPGVPEELADSVFDPYVRAARCGNAPGNGLGLTMARALARAMQGDLELAPREGRLACFVLRLPAA